MEPDNVVDRALDPCEERQPFSLYQPETDKNGATVGEEDPPGQGRSDREVVQEDMQQVGKGTPEAR